MHRYRLLLPLWAGILFLFVMLIPQSATQAANFSVNDAKELITAYDSGLWGMSDLDGQRHFFDDSGVVNTGVGPAPVIDRGAYVQQTCAGSPYFAATAGELIDAINCANLDPDPDTIVLTANLLLNVVDNTTEGANGLPAITSDITIEGGAISRASTTAPDFRIFYVANTGNLTLNNLILTNGRATGAGVGGDGGVIYNFGGTVTINNSGLAHNHADRDSGVIENAGGTLTIRNSILHGNRANRNAGIVLSFGNATLNIANSLFYGNSSGGTGGVLYNSLSDTVIVNSTFTNNSASNAGTIDRLTGTVSVVNSIVWGNTPVNDQIRGTATVNYSIVQGGFGGTANLDADPLFVNPPANNYRLQANSPAIDSGNNNAYDSGLWGTNDLAGEPRFFNDVAITNTGIGTPPIIDRGAYERQTDSCAGSPYSVATPNELIDAINCANLDPDPDTITLTTNIALTAVHNLLGGANGLPSITTPITIEGGGFTLTREDSAADFRIFRVAASGDLTLNNITLTNGRATGAGVGGEGGAIFNNGGTVTINNSTLSNHHADQDSGAIENVGGTLTIRNSILHSNRANGSAGVIFSWNSATLTIVNSLFYNNSSGSNGGAVINGVISTTAIINSTFTGNSAANLGGAIRGNVGTTSVANSIVWGNTALTDSQINGAAVTVNHSIVQGGYAGTANLNADPLFVAPPANNYRLQANSPAIDSGNNNAYDSGLWGTSDLDGNARIINSIIDRGAYEFDGQLITVEFAAPTSAELEADGLPADLLTITTSDGQTTETAATITVAVTGGTATPDDYVIIGAAVVTISAGTPDGATLDLDEAIVIVDNLIVQPDRTLELELVAPFSAPVRIGTQATHTHTIIDDDTADVIVTPTALTILAGESDVYSVVLLTQPADSVTVTITAGDPAICEVQPAELTFTVDNWDTPQTVTVTVLSGDAENCTLTHTVSGGGYDGLMVADVVVAINALPEPEATPDPLPEATPDPLPMPDPTPQPDISVFDPAISKLGLLLPGQLGVTGERLEWVTTVSNRGNAAGFDVRVVDVLRDELRIDRVEAPGAAVSIDGQTVTVTYETILPGQTFNFSIFTTVLTGDVQIDNTVCLFTADQQLTCATAPPVVTSLPATGERPLWAELLRRLLGR